jgi:hypothetical protein
MTNRIYSTLLVIMGCLLPALMLAQASPPDPPIEPVPDSVQAELKSPSLGQGLSLGSVATPSQGRKPPIKRFSMFGYYRLLLYSRNMTMPYPGLSPYERVFAATGDTYREPMLSLTVTGRPNGRASFGSELFIFTPYAGNWEDNVFTMNLGISMYGNFRTDIGKFGIRAGGINWYSISPFTMGTFQILDRYSIFERTPWEGVTHTNKYDNYYQTGRVSRDNRWGYVAFQGFVLEGSSLPGDFSFKAVYGKTQPNGGLFSLVSNGQGGFNVSPAATDPFADQINPGIAGNVPNYNNIGGDSRFVPSLVAGGQLQKNFGDNYVAFNTMNSWSFLDTLGDDRRGFQVNTLSFDYEVAKIRLSGEMGVGRYFTPTDRPNWDEALMLRVNLPKEYTLWPMEFQFYQIGKNFFNINSEVQTFSNPKFNNASFGANQIGQPTAGNALPITGQLAHNRRGVNVSTQGEIGPLVLALNYGVAKELEAITTQLSYDHRVNGLALSRIYIPFPANATGPTVFGPYNRKVSYFRGVFEQVQTTDVDPLTGQALNPKYFVSAEVAAKYKTKIAERPLYLFYLGAWQSAKNEFSIHTNMNENAYLSAQYHELDLYYELFPKFLLAGYLGFEHILGGAATEWDAVTALPRDQLGQAYGLGFDWTLSENAGLFIRHRRMIFEDRNFSLDQFRGHETTIELKVFF